MSVPSGAFVARRNGHVFITGNSGFPKSHNISVAIDKAAGATREVVGSRLHNVKPFNDDNGWNSNNTTGYHEYTAPATPEAAAYSGYGSALKPSHEIILCFRKPVDKSYANNALVHGCGGLNIDATRVPISDGATMARNNKPGDNGWKNSSGGANNAALHGEPAGRWPPNLIHDGSDAIKAEFDKAGERDSGGPSRNPQKYQRYSDNSPGWGNIGTSGNIRGYADSDRSAARFFPICPPDVPRLVYHSKASSGERNEGLDGMENTHCTVKPLSLMQWLCRLVRQPANNLILDPFGGSGTTGVAALLEGCDTIIIEREADYIPIIRARLEHFDAEVSMTPVVTKGKPTDTDNLPLFA